MGLMVLGWAFFGFIYFKVGFEATTSTGISVMAAFLLAITLTAMVFCAAGVYDTKLSATGHIQTRWGRFKRNIFYFFLFSASFVLISRIIIFGLSNDLSNEIGFYRRSIGVLPKNYFNAGFVASLLLTIFPIFFHFMAFQYPRRNRDLD
ncbi:hypothetical protein [Brucella anthropi]|uniref:hypothetical protein n=1 Tax=Brucella anthropi TaxID=529 RepID=UPI0005BDFFF7|nr:hypothetical protein [Brucella anthropi]KIU70213.1 hypothetical protein TR92_01575 [Brucella anthropi]